MAGGLGTACPGDNTMRPTNRPRTGPFEHAALTPQQIGRVKARHRYSVDLNERRQGGDGSWQPTIRDGMSALMTSETDQDDPLNQAFDPTVAANYPLWTTERVRYSDQDPLGHVNNNAYGIYFETARLDFFLAADLRHGSMADAAGVVRRLDMEFLRELTWPSTLRIGTRLVGLGTSSFTYRQGLFVGDICHAIAFTVSVGFDLKTRTKVVLTETHKQGLRRAGLPG